MSAVGINLVELFTETRRLLTEKGWTKEAFARNASGDVVASNDPSATCYCLSGAIRAVTKDDLLFIQARLFIKEAQGSNALPITVFNDTSKSLEDILVVLDKATELAMGVK